MAGHLFVVRGDLLRLACEAWLLPTDEALHVTGGWWQDAQLAERLRARGASHKWQSGPWVKVFTGGRRAVPLDAAPGPRPYLTQIGASGDRRNRVAQGLAVAIQLAGVEGIDRIEVAVKPGEAHRHSGGTEVPPLLAHLPGKPARPGAVANPHRCLANRGAWFAAAAQAGANHPCEQQGKYRAQTQGPGNEKGHAGGSKCCLKQFLERKMGGGLDLKWLTGPG